ncbi:membrane transporter [Mycena vitilis]|nr:membrane transporter [Mycena vitilis]
MSLSTAATVDFVVHRGFGEAPSWDVSKSSATAPARSSLTIHPVARSTPADEIPMHARGNTPPAEDPELRLPSRGSLCIMIATNALLQFAFFLPVSSAASYAEYLGGTAVFSGITIGIPTLFAGLAIFPLTKYDEGRYTRPLLVAFVTTILGNILHALAYPAKFLYLILIGRIVSGLGFTGFMYIKKYCSDSRVIGIRRRTALASWLVLGQAFGFSAGPFVGGVLFKVGFPNNVFNGYTSPGWVTASFTSCFAILSMCLFKDVPKRPSGEDPAGPVVPHPEDYGFRQLTTTQWGIIVSMCWDAMTCFFILGAWEANIPIFTASVFHYSPYAAGNFIGLGGVATIPFLLANVRFAPRLQDRVTLVTGSAIGIAGLVLTLVLLATDKIVFGSFYVCWFLVALGFNLASTCTFSLLSKQFPSSWNGRTSRAIQYSIYVPQTVLSENLLNAPELISF